MSTAIVIIAVVFIILGLGLILYGVSLAPSTTNPNKITPVTTNSNGTTTANNHGWWIAAGIFFLIIGFIMVGWGWYSSTSSQKVTMEHHHDHIDHVDHYGNTMAMHDQSAQGFYGQPVM